MHSPELNFVYPGIQFVHCISAAFGSYAHDIQLSGQDKHLEIPASVILLYFKAQAKQPWLLSQAKQPVAHLEHFPYSLK